MKMSMAAKRGQKKERHCDNGSKGNKVDELQEKNEVIGNATNADSIVVRKRGLPRKVRVDYAPATSRNMSVATNWSEGGTSM